jgi:hypothetical protein
VPVLPIVIPEASMSIPANMVFGAIVVAPVGAQKTSQADAPPSVVTAVVVATVVSAPWMIKMYVPAPLRMMPVPVDAAPTVQ